VTVLFLLLLVIGEAQDPRGIAEDKKKGPATTLARATIASPLSIRNDPHGIRKYTKDIPLEQSALSSAIRRSWIISVF
jgi:hypothetical protein